MRGGRLFGKRKLWLVRALHLIQRCVLSRRRMPVYREVKVPSTRIVSVNNCGTISECDGIPVGMGESGTSVLTAQLRNDGRNSLYSSPSMMSMEVRPVNFPKSGMSLLPLFTKPARAVGAYGMPFFFQKTLSQSGYTIRNP